MKITDVRVIEGKVHYEVEDKSGNNVPIYATKEELIRTNPYLLLNFFQNLIN